MKKKPQLESAASVRSASTHNAQAHKSAVPTAIGFCPSKSRLDDDFFRFLFSQPVSTLIEDCGMNLIFVQVPKLAELWQVKVDKISHCVFLHF